MAYKRRFAVSKAGNIHIQHSPAIYEKVGDGVVRSTHYPTTNLTPEDFEIDNLLAAGVNTDSKVKFEDVNSIDRIDTVLGAVADTDFTLSEKEKQFKKSE